MAAEISGGGSDGEAETSDDGAADGCLGNTKGEVSGVGGDAEGKLGAGLDDDGERTGPELFRETVEGCVEVASELIGLGDLVDKEREGLMTGAGFEIVDTVDSTEIDGIDG
jgi:hypothetical protein